MNEIEKTYVLDAYNTIATNFDLTRVYIWKCVKEFVDSFVNKDSFILDAGCGNGKNMKYMIDREYKNVFGCDFTANFVSICKSKSLNVIEANILNLPYTDELFDYVLCIAVLHHLSTIENRLITLKELYRVTKIGGKILITVSSLEYPFSKNRTTINNVDRESLIEWNSYKKEKLSDRYYHLFVKNEIEDLCANINITNIESFFEHNNWCIIITKC